MSTIDFNLPGDFTKLANARTLIAVVTTVNDDNTLNLTLFKQNIINVPTHYHCRHQHINHARRVFIEGDTVICLYTGEGAAPSAVNLTVMGFPDGYLRDCSLASIILHPRSGSIIQLSYAKYVDDQYGGYTIIKTTPGVSGGWRDGQTPLTTGYVYPLVDNDSASFVLAKRTATLSGEFAGAEGNYGNLYWTNDAVWNSAEKTWNKPHICLSWRGTPTRHFRLPSNINLPGLSITERVISGALGDKPDFTPFGVSLYSGGEAIALAPRYSWPSGGTLDRCLILGAMQNSNGVTFIVTQNDHYDKPNDAGGFFLGVWSNVVSSSLTNIKVDGWELLLEVEHTREGLPWFGNSSGSEFVCGNGDAVTAAFTAAKPPIISASYVAYTQPTGTQSQTLAGEIRRNVAYSASATGINHFYEFNKDGKVNGVASISSSASSIVGHGDWGFAGASGPEGTVGTWPHQITEYTDTAYDYYDVFEYCYCPTLSNYTNEDIANLPHLSLGTALRDWEISIGGPCMGYSDGLPWGKGTIRTVRGPGLLTEWVGTLPGIEHSIDTDFSIVVCGVTIPATKTTRRFKAERTPHNTQEAELSGHVRCWIEEHCDTQSSVIHFLDERYGVCLYRTTRGVIDLPRKQSQEVDHYIAYGTATMSATIIVRPEDYKASLTETWHLIVGGVDSVVAETTLEIFPFGEPMHSDYYEDVCKVLTMPKIPASSSVAPSSPTNTTNAAAGDFGAYEDGYDNPFGTQAEADGGTDYFYPEWCRLMPIDPLWADIAASRYGFTQPGNVTPAYGTVPWTPPDVVVDPIPIGSFARHPVVGDLYQFLLSKFDGNTIVVTSSSINSLIDGQLAKSGLSTHDTTLYYPIAVI